MKKRIGLPALGLKAKIQAIFIAIFLFAAIVMCGALYLLLTPQMYERSVTSLEDNARLIHSLVDASVRSTIRDHLITVADQARKAAAHYYGMYENGKISEKAAFERFKQLLLDPRYGKIGKTGYLAGVNTDGVLEIHPYAEGENASKYAFIQKAIAMKNGYLEYEWANPGDKKPRLKAGGVAYFAPWHLLVWASAYRSEFIDFVDRKGLEGIINGVSLGRDGRSFVLTGTGVLLSETGTSGKQVLDQRDRNGRLYFKDMLTTARQKPNVVHTILYPGESSPTGNPYARLAAYEYYQPLDWLIVSSIPYSDVSAVFRQILLVIVLLMVGVFILTTIAVNLAFSRILRPVKTVQELTRAVSVGDLTQRVPIASRDEIGQMTEQFNVISANFERLIGGMRDTSSVLGSAVHDLSASAQEIASTSNEQAAAVKEIVSTMEDSDQLSRGIATKSDEVAKVSRNTREVVHSGFAVIQASLEKMNEIQQANSDTIAGIENLSEKIESIWEIVNIINGIADQTKIIAFNAELEAASAGDAGKNFQIVATEIRRLADSTVESTGEIRDRIHEIQNSSDKLIIASEEGTAKIMAGLAQSNTLRQQFEEILNSSEISATSAEQIASSIRRQVAAFEQILVTLKQISEGINNFAASTRATSAAAGNIQTQSDILNGLVGTFKVREEVTDGQR